MHDYTRSTSPYSFYTCKHDYEIHERHHTRLYNLPFIEINTSVFASQLPYYTFSIIGINGLTQFLNIHHDITCKT